jgi:hypothetical protein
LNAIQNGCTKLGVVSFKEKGKFDGGWFWALPGHVPQDASVGEEV